MSDDVRLPAEQQARALIDSQLTAALRVPAAMAAGLDGRVQDEA